VAALFAALMTARALSNKHTGPLWRMLLLAASLWAVAVTCIAPSRTDALAAAGRSYERDQRWPEATIAYKAAARSQPGVSAYQSDLGRASIEWAVRSQPPMRDQLLEQGRLALQAAVDLNPLDIEAQRRLAAHSRIRASFLQGAERDQALQQADRAYASVSAMAPAWTPLWIEWAWVDVDRGLATEASRKLERALALNAHHPAATALAARLDAH
jgi:tetratricopeptide (TPR) repeat protein